VIDQSPAVFLDTSAWLSALNPREQHHERARDAYESLLKERVPLLTTNLIVAEMHILIARGRGPQGALDFLDALDTDLRHEVVYVDRELEVEAVDRWIRGHPGVRLSLADATALELTRRRRVRKALALDAHFAIAGLQTIPARM